MKNSKILVGTMCALIATITASCGGSSGGSIVVVVAVVAASILAVVAVRPCQMQLL